MQLPIARLIPSPKVAHFFVLLIVALVAGLVAPLLLERPASAATLPSGFEDKMVASLGSADPTGLAPTPDGRLLVTSKGGKLRVYRDGTSGTKEALDISGRICTNSERGLLGVAVDPNFSTNQYIYLYYTPDKFNSCPTLDPTNPKNPVNRVSRFVMSGDTVDSASEKVLIDNIPSIGRHNAGDVHFGKDGYLYVAVGDGGCDYAGDSGCQAQNDASRDTHVLVGKILRITRDGGIPPDNPYLGSDSARCNLTGRTDPGKHCQETFAMGLRNPFRFAFDPDASGTRFFIGDVGENEWEEVVEGKKGADYGWNLCEGNHDNPSRPGSVVCSAAPYTPPIHEYSHSATGCASITGQSFVPNNAGWPASYNDSYLFGDYVCNKIFTLTPASGGGGYTMSEFASGLEAGPIVMAFGPSTSGKALYYGNWPGSGELHRITFTGTTNQQPTAAVAATPTSGDVPLTVSFDAGASSDPDPGDKLTYIWDFGDGSARVETNTPTASHVYTSANTYTATLTVRDTSGAEDIATVKIDAGNVSPEPKIETPTSDRRFKVGEEIVLHGSATDPQDGQLPDSALGWEVLRHHNCNHTHPFLSQTGNDVPFVAPEPEDLAATDPSCNYLEIRLTATDSQGGSKTVSQILKANTVDVTFESQPTGARVEVNGETFTAPQTLTSWENYRLRVNAPSPQTISGTNYEFASWSDGKEQSHDILTGASPTTYTATFKSTPNDFSDNWTGTDGGAWNASRWTTDGGTSATADILSNQGRMRFENVSGARARAIASMPKKANTEVLTSFRFPSTGAKGFLQIFSRASGNWVSGYPGSGYCVEISNSTASVGLRKVSSGTETQLANASVGQATTTKQWVRFRVEGTTLKAKVWTDGTPEPSTWEIQATDSSFSEAGVLQLRWARASAATGAREVLLDDLTVRGI